MSKPRKARKAREDGKDKKAHTPAATAPQVENTTPSGRRYLARVYVSLKPTVNDPEGNTIAGALASLGFGGVAAVRSGRYFQLRLTADGRRNAEHQVEQMCSRLLANPVIETYTFDVDPEGER